VKYSVESVSHVQIDARHLFKAHRENVIRLAKYLKVNPWGMPYRTLVVMILFRLP